MGRISLLLLLSVVGCVRGQQRVVAAGQICESGTRQTCRCDDGRSGNALCAPSGTTYAACDCRSLRVLPETAVLSATRSRDFVFERSSDLETDVSWRVEGDATVDASGRLVAGASTGVVVLHAESDGVEGVARVTVVALPARPQIALPSAVSVGELVSATITSPQAGVTYAWTALNADFASAAIGTEVSLVPIEVGALFVSVSATNAAGDGAVPSGVSAEVVPPIGDEDVPLLVAPLAVSAGRQGAGAFVANPLPGLTYVWTLDDVEADERSSVFHFTAGAEGATHTLSVVAQNGAGTRSASTTRTIEVVAGNTLEIAVGSLSSPIGEVDGAAESARLLPAMAIRHVGDALLWLERPFVDSVTGGWLLRMRAIVDGTVSSVWSTQVEGGEGRASIAKNGSVVGSISGRMTRTLTTITQSGVASVVSTLDVSQPAAMDLLPLHYLKDVAAGDEKYFAAAVGAASPSGPMGPNNAWLLRFGEDVDTELSTGTTSTCNDLTPPAFESTSPMALYAPDDDTLWFVDNARAIRKLTVAAMSVERICGKCENGAPLPHEAIVVSPTGTAYLLQKDARGVIHRVRANVNPDLCDSVVIEGFDYATALALSASGDLFVADGGRLQRVDGASGDMPALVPLAGAVPAAAAFGEISAFAVDPVTGHGWVVEQKAGPSSEPRCVLSSVSPSGEIEAHIDGACVARDSIFGTASAIGVVTSLAVDVFGRVYLLDAGDALDTHRLLRIYDPSSRSIATRAAVEDAVAIGVDASQTVHVISGSASASYGTIAPGASSKSSVMPLGSVASRAMAIDDAHKRVFLGAGDHILMVSFGDEVTTTLIGQVATSPSSAADGPCDLASFFDVTALAVGDDGALWVADGNHFDDSGTAPTTVLRRVSFDAGCSVSHVLGSATHAGAVMGAAATARLGHVVGMGRDLGGDLLIADSFERAILRFRP